MIMACPMDTNDEDLPKFESLEEFVEDGILFIYLSIITYCITFYTKIIIFLNNLFNSFGLYEYAENNFPTPIFANHQNQPP